MICSLLGCGLVLDLDPPEESATDASPPDARQVDASVEDASPKDGSPDGTERDGQVVMPDALDLPDVLDLPDALDAPDLPDVPDFPDVPEVDGGIPCASDFDCPDDGPCSTWICDGICIEALEPNGATCDDGLFCTVDDRCEGGRCGGRERACGVVTDCSVPACGEVRGCFREARRTGLECEPPNGIGMCLEGACALISCIDDFADCDGDGACDANLSVDPTNCGGCGLVCADGLCRDGSCP